MPLSASERSALQALVDQKRREKTGQNQSEDDHGTPARYKKKKCRCDVCRAYARDVQRRYRKNNPDQVKRATARNWVRKKARLEADPVARAAEAKRKNDWEKRKQVTDPEWYQRRLEYHREYHRQKREERRDEALGL